MQTLEDESGIKQKASRLLVAGRHYTIKVK